MSAPRPPVPPAFDPNGQADSDGGIFGLPYTEAESALVLIPVPWDATTSYHAGTAQGPAAILAASGQIDLFDLDVVEPYAAGIHLQDIPDEVLEWNARARAAVERLTGSDRVTLGADVRERAHAEVDALSGRMVARVRDEARRLLAAGKLVGVVGGDHSVPLGAIEALAERHGPFGILHFDAHHDLRAAYQGFRHSHASIMRNVMDGVPKVERLVQVGIRDFCAEEHDYAQAAGGRIAVFYDQRLAERRAAGMPWAEQAREIIQALPEKVYVSFDIDGLDPAFCPHTGTPVPGGVDFNEALYVIREVVRSGRTIVGFDLVEVAPGPDGRDEWDANVGMRLLYRLAAWTLVSQGRARRRDA